MNSVRRDGRARFRIYLNDPKHHDMPNIGSYDNFKENPDNIFWKPVEVPRYPEPVMKVIRALWKYTVDTAEVTYSRVYSKLSLPITKDFVRECRSLKEDFSVYDCGSNKWLLKPSDSNLKYNYAYNGKAFVETDGFKTENAGGDKKLWLCGKFTRLMQEPNLIDATADSNHLMNGFTVPKLDVIVGVPGCGKTTYILKNHTVGDLVLTSSSEGAMDIRERVAKQRGGEPNAYRQTYRTVDSYLINSKEVYNTVWIDEALMRHAGDLFLICLYTQAQAVHILGDPNQIGYINRVGSISLLYSDFRKFFVPTRTLRTSYRCPVDVIAHISNRYAGGAVSASKVVRSMSTRPVTALANVPNHRSPDVKYPVFKQAEKEVLTKAGYDVSTIHEFQGKQAKHVIIVRTSTKIKEEIYKSDGHILVAISRHTQNLEYYTPVTDPLKQLIDKLLTTVNLEEAKLKIKGGAIAELSYTRPVVDSECNFVTSLLAQTVGHHSDLILGIEKKTEIIDKLPIELTVLNTADGGVETLISLHDALLPGNAYHHHYLDTENLLLNEIDLDLDGVYRTESKQVPKPAIYDKLRPVLPTMMPVSRRSSQMESIAALNKRNMAVPDLDGMTDAHVLGERLLTQFVNSFVDPEAKFMLEEFKSNPIAPNAEGLEEWLNIQAPSVRSQIVGPGDNLFEWEWSRYKFMIKPTVKPTLDTTAPFVTNALQTIAYQEKYMNAIFCPIFREMDRRLDSVMKKRFKVLTRIDNEGFGEYMNEQIPPWKFDELLRRGAAMLEI